MTSTQDRAAMAETYSHAGWAVFPVAPAGKLPLIPAAHPKGDPLRATCRGECGRWGHGLHDATRNLDAIRVWWMLWPDANIGIPAGGNGLAILDIDPKGGGGGSLARLAAAVADVGDPLPATLTQLTGGDGAHFVFRAPEGGIKNTARAFGPDLPGLDTRGTGGYIVAAPSIHASGGEYRWLDFFADTAPWPAALTLLMDWRPQPPPAARAARALPTAASLLNGSGMSYGEKALSGELERLRQTGEGARNHALNAAAFNLGQLIADGKLDEHRVRAELVATGTSIGLSLNECEKTVESGFAGGALKPRRAA